MSHLFISIVYIDDTQPIFTLGIVFGNLPSQQRLFGSQIENVMINIAVLKHIYRKQKPNFPQIHVGLPNIGLHTLP